MGGRGWILSLDAGRAGRVGRGVLAAPGGGGHQRRQSNDTADGIEGPDVNIWPSPSGFVPLLGGAAGLLHGGDVQR